MSQVATDTANATATTETPDGATTGPAAIALTSSAAATASSSAGASIDQKTTAKTRWYLSDWRIQLTSLLFFVVQHLKTNGHVRTMDDDIWQLENLVPVPIREMKPVSIIIASVHTLAVTQRVTTVFREWGRRMKSVPIPEETQSFQHSAVLNPASQEFSHSVAVRLHMRVLPKELPLKLFRLLFLLRK